MGLEASCSAEIDGKRVAGKALLETDELLFRGEQRLRVPLREIRSVDARDGRLELVYDGGRVTLELGTHAERWAERIRNPRSLLDKLDVKPESKVVLHGVPAPDFADQLRARGIEAHADVASADLIFLRADSLADLAHIDALVDVMPRSAALWIVAPKGGAPPREIDVLNAGRAAGLVDVKVARFSDTHTAHKFVIPKKHR